MSSFTPKLNCRTPMNLLSSHFHLSVSTIKQFNSLPISSQYPNIPKSKLKSVSEFNSKYHLLQPIKAQMPTSTTTNPDQQTQSDSDDKNARLQEIKQFDEAKIGVKGLVDRGLAAIPSFFIHPNPPDRSDPNSSSSIGLKPTIPVIDFSAPRETIVEQVRRASSDLGFFQIINHSVPLASINKILNSLKEFYELPDSIKMEYYTRDPTYGVAYSTNFDIYKSKAASWRDSIQIRLAPDPPEWERVPLTCREAVREWDEQVLKISEELLSLLCEGLGLENRDRLKEMSCLDGRLMAAHYYPYCPQPELTAGLTSHTDPGVLTVLVQNMVRGLQVLVGEEWVDVEPVEGAIVINIGDILQIISNDEYVSVQHRVLANSDREARVSSATFLKPGLRDNLYGPLPELVSDQNPPLYKHVTFADYMAGFFSKELDGKTLKSVLRN